MLYRSAVKSNDKCTVYIRLTPKSKLYSVNIHASALITERLRNGKERTFSSQNIVCDSYHDNLAQAEARMQVLLNRPKLINFRQEKRQ